jgi:DNA helicase-2/ATP-dependent DNA helicase PcrA
VKESNLDLSTLNPQQREAVEHSEGPLVIYAGAGSGKTRVVCYRIARLIESGVPPSSIMAVTFTNKAAREMRERIEGLVHHRAKSLIISTFHSACARFLRTYAREMGYTEAFSIYDDDDQKALLKDVFKDLNVDEKLLNVAVIKGKIDKLKNQGETPQSFKLRIQTRAPSVHEMVTQTFRGYGEDEHAEIILKCYELYQQRLKSQNAMDFNDLLLVTTQMLEEKKHVLEQLQNRFRYFTVDEFQDTNPIQFKFIKLLCGHTKNLCIVGDDDQSIYSWRGAEPSFILDFDKHFAGAKVVKLEQNYRSVATIIQAATAIIAQNLHRAPKTLWTAAAAGDRIKIKRGADAQEEADFICSSIVKSYEKGAKFSHFAILYRTNAQSRALEVSLRRRMLPYIIYGAVRFYERAEIKILLAYLRLLINPDDDAAFQKALGAPRRGLGEKAIGNLKRISIEMNLSLARVAARVARNEIEGEVGRGLSALKELMTQFSKWQGRLSFTGRPSEVLGEIVSDIRFEEYLRTNYPEDFDDRWLNVVELKNALIDYEVQFAQSKDSSESGWQGEAPQALRDNILALFLEQAMLTVEPTVVNVQAGVSEAITLMTVHSAKGLEFDHVFISGLEEGILPHMNSLENPAAIEEERRLMYVAVTRARKALTLTYIERNRYKGEFRAVKSRFLEEIPPELVENLDTRTQNTYSFGMTPAARTVRGATASPSPTPKESVSSFLRKADDVLSENRTTSAGSEAPWRSGGQVRHKIFGLGVIQKVEKSLDGYRLEVRFPQHGVKRLLHTYVTPV